MILVAAFSHPSQLDCFHYRKPSLSPNLCLGLSEPCVHDPARRNSCSEEMAQICLSEIDFGIEILSGFFSGSSVSPMLRVLIGQYDTSDKCNSKASGISSRHLGHGAC